MYESRYAFVVMRLQVCCNSMWPAVVLILCISVPSFARAQVAAQVADVPAPSPAPASLTPQCLEALPAAVAKLMSTPAVVSNRSEVDEVLLQLVSTCLGTKVEPVKALLSIGLKEAAALADYLAVVFQQATGFVIQRQDVPFDQLDDAILSLLKAGDGAQRSLANIWTYDPVGVVDLDEAGAFLDLRPYVTNDPFLNWVDVLPFFREVSVVYKGRIVGMPQAVSLPYMYFRRDWVTRFNITIPQTWEELVEVAAQYNGTDWDGDGQKEYSLCLSLHTRNNLQAWTFYAILASMTQPGPMSLGFLLDPLTMEPMIDTPAGRRALELYRQLFQYSVPEVTDPNTSPFYYSKCIFALRYTETFKLAIVANYSVAMQMGIAAYPGSRTIYDRATRTLIDCHSPAAGGQCGDAVTRGNTTFHINRTPFSGLAVGSAINPYSDPLYYGVSYKYLSAVQNPAFHDQAIVFNPMSTAGPLRTSNLVASKWVAMGYNPQTVDEFLNVTRRVVYDRNIVVDMRIAKATQYRFAIQDRLMDLTIRNVPLDTVVRALDTQLRSFLPLDPVARAKVVEGYWAAIGFLPPSPPPPAPPPPPPPPPKSDGSSNSKVGVIVPAVVVPTAVALIAAAIGLLLLRMSRRAQHRTLWGAVMAPHGKNTTLAITDIESSTALWEALDARVMDEVLAKHHTVVRVAAQKHAGYESGTEGDSFILAFHEPRDAVLFATEIQEALMQVEWPPQLLSVEGCHPIYVTPLSGRQLTQSAHAGACTGAASKGSLTTRLARFVSPRTFMRRISAGGRRSSSGTPGGNRSSFEHTDVEAMSEINFDNPSTRSSRAGYEATRYSGYGVAADKGPASTGAIRVNIDNVLAAPPGGSLHNNGAVPAPWVSGGGNAGGAEAAGPPKVTTGGLPPKAFAEKLQHLADEIRGHQGRDSVDDTPSGGGQSSGTLLDAAAPPSGMYSEAGGSDTPPLGLTPPASVASLPLGDGGAIADTRGSVTGKEMTVLRHLERCHPPADGPGPGRQLLFRGLRVRVGISTGIESSHDEVVFNRTVGRTQYTGKLAAAAKRVQDAAQGGMVLLSEATKHTLHLDPKDGVTVAHMGTHVLEAKALGEQPPPEHVYAVFKDVLIGRFAVLGPIRSLVQPPPTPGFLTAPYGTATMGFMHVVGLPSLQAFDAALTAEALGVYRRTAAFQLNRLGGYLVEESEGLLLVAFARPTAAIRWALCTVRACLEAEWSAELLAHELGEEIGINTLRVQPLTTMTGSGGASQGSGGGLTGGDTSSLPAAGVSGNANAGRASGLLLRGLRLKCGLDSGKVSASVHAVLGRMQYRGRVLNRAARISGVTKTGQVWCSDTAWNAHIQDTPLRLPGGASLSNSFLATAETEGAGGASVDAFSATPLGFFKLKGVPGEVELLQCHWEVEALMANAAMSFTGNTRATYNVARRGGSATNATRNPAVVAVAEGDDEGEASEGAGI